MIKAVKIFAVLVALLLVAAGAFFLFIRESIPDLAAPPSAISTAAADYGPALEKSREALVKLRAEDFYPSLSVSVIHDGAEVWAEAAGYADLKERTAATADTVYAIGSVSKSLTAAAAMKLVEAGVVDLDTPVHEYAPELPQHYHGVTMRQLLSHQAGVRHYGFAFIPPFFTENALDKKFTSVEDSLSIFIDDPLLFAPDEGFAYSTYGYTLASYVMERASGEEFLTFMERTLFTPLGLAATAADRRDAPPAHRATDYMSALRRLGVIRAPHTDSSYKWAGGGLASTPRDLAAFGAALLDGNYLGAGSFEAMTTPRMLPDGSINPQQYGLAWRIGTMPYPRGSEETVTIIHHGGTAAGSQCALLLTPSFDMTVAICGNAFTGGSGPLILLAADIARNFEEAASVR